MWRDQTFAEKAAHALRLTAPDLLEFGLIDAIIPEPEGGAHADHQRMAELLSESLEQSLEAVRHLGNDDRVARRYEKFRKMGEFEERTQPQPRSHNAD